MGFLYWWYFFFVNNFFQENVVSYFLYSLNQTNVIAMVRNILKPLYQDESSFGRGIGLIIRMLWISYGTVISFIKIIPTILISLLLVLLPVIPIFGILVSFFKFL